MTLSDKRMSVGEVGNTIKTEGIKENWFRETDVKQFIKDLKEFGDRTIFARFGMVGSDRWEEEIDNLAGENLI